MTEKILVVLTVLAVALTVMTASIEAQHLPPEIPTTLDLNLLNTDGTNIDTTLLLTIDYYDNDGAAQSINSVNNAGDGSGKTVFWDVYNGKSNVYSELSAKEGTNITVTITGYEPVTVTAVRGGYVRGDYYLNTVSQIPPTAPTTTVPTTTILKPSVAWVKTYDSGGNDKTLGVAVDLVNNIIVTGTSGTIKYDSDGNQLWGSPFSGNGVAVDLVNNIIVTGTSGTIKYDSDGNQLWTVGYGGTGVSVDSAGNVIVTGTSILEGWRPVYHVRKYDPSGNQIWTKVGYSDGDWSTSGGVAVDSDDNVIITRHTWTYLVMAICTLDSDTIKYGPDGTILWKKTYFSGLVGSGDWELFDITDCGGPVTYGVVADSDGNVIVTGDSGTMKYDSDGNRLWTVSYAGRGVSVDSGGNVIVTGYSQLVGSSDYLTIKYDPDGNRVWNFTYDSGGDDYAQGVVVDTVGSVIVTGYSQLVGSSDYLTIKYIVLNATVDIRPDTLDLNSHGMGRHGMGISAYIELPGGYDVADINVSTVVLGGTIPAELRPAYIGDYDRDGIADLLVTFERSAVQKLLNGRYGDVELTVTGSLTDGTPFNGIDTIRVIEKSSRKTGHMVRRR